MLRNVLTFASAIVVAASLTLTLPAIAADKKATPKAPAKTTAKTQPGWAVRCNNPGNGLVCKAFQTLSLRKTGQRLVTVSVQRNQDGKSAAMLVHLPHGLFLPAGAQVKADKGKGTQLVVQTCNARGCYAGGKITAAGLDNWFDGKILTVAFQTI